MCSMPGSISTAPWTTDNYALQSRIEIGGYSMTYYRDILNELFFDVDSVLDPDRPPVVYDE